MGSCTSLSNLFKCLWGAPFLHWQNEDVSSHFAESSCKLNAKSNCAPRTVPSAYKRFSEDGLIIIAINPINTKSSIPRAEVVPTMVVPYHGKTVAEVPPCLLSIFPRESFLKLCSSPRTVMGSPTLLDEALILTLMRALESWVTALWQT